MSENDPKAPRSEAGEATAEQGQVLLDGPDGVAVAMTPGSAEETGRRLVSAADEARGQADGPEGDPVDA